MKTKMMLLILALFLVPSVVQAEMRQRVWYMPDGTVRVTMPSPNACLEGEPQADCEKRLFEETANEVPELREALDSGNYEDIDPALKPDRKDRKYWRGSKATGIIIDTAAKNADNQERLKRQADKNKAKSKLKALGLTDDEIDALMGK